LKRLSRTAILLVSHGSKARNANQSLFELAAALEATGEYLKVQYAFLELNTPTIPEGLALCQQAGAREIILIPYFLSMGMHVREDLPRLIREWEAGNPETPVKTAGPLGLSPIMVSLLQERVNSAVKEEK
jgi:sirohydrochlorin ferrochelatase